MESDEVRGKRTGLPFDILTSTFLLFTIAGSEPTATIICGKNPERLQRLVVEVRGAFKSDTNMTLYILHSHT